MGFSSRMLSCRRPACGSRILMIFVKLDMAALLEVVRGQATDIKGDVDLADARVATHRMADHDGHAGGDCAGRIGADSLTGSGRPACALAGCASSADNAARGRVGIAGCAERDGQGRTGTTGRYAHDAAPQDGDGAVIQRAPEFVVNGVVGEEHARSRNFIGWTPDDGIVSGPDDLTTKNGPVAFCG